ncbi:MAG: UPF0149 family protein [Gammaproteobacteria bacterium]|nr:UPF0149 family protein [Gammaproteobacteria bacterium]
MEIAPDYDTLTDVLATAEVAMSAAEAHGIIAGACCAPQTPPLNHLFFGTSSDAPTREVEYLLTLLVVLQEDTQRRLGETDFEFEPLLPEEAGTAQVEAIGDWARGFVLGLTAAGVREPTELPDEAGEFMRDAVAIGEVQADEAPSEAQAREIAELIEYLRVGVQVVYETCRG